MPTRAGEISLAKRVVFSAIMLSVPVVAAVAAVTGYYAYRKIEENIVYTQPFGQLDDEIGWVLKPRVLSGVSHRSRLTGEVFYDVEVTTNALGFRSATAEDPIAAGSILAVGDSWTFGVAVNYGESYPAQLSARLKMPVANLGVPAHGTAQTILLLERQAARLRPKVVVHVNLGLWARSVCRGHERPANILKPCFWRSPTKGEVELVRPPPGHVTEMARLGVYPGGWLTAGHNTWTYYLISRPVVRLTQLAARLGLTSGPVAEDDPGSADRAAVLHDALGHFLRLAQAHDFVFVLFDPGNDYAQAAKDLADRFAGRLVYLGADVHKREVEPRTASIAPERRQVPRDGHFTGAYMAAWVDVLVPRIAHVLAERAAQAPSSVDREPGRQ